MSKIKSNRLDLAIERIVIMKTLDELIENINRILHSNKIVVCVVWTLIMMIGLVGVCTGNSILCLLTALLLYVLFKKY